MIEKIKNGTFSFGCGVGFFLAILPFFYVHIFACEENAAYPEQYQTQVERSEKGSSDKSPLPKCKISLISSTSDTLTQWIMVFFTGIMAVLTAVAVYFIWQTARFARATLEEAKRTTSAANETIATTREIGEVQVRAYVDVREMSDDANSGIVIICQNSGSTPATYFKAGAVAKFVERKSFRSNVEIPDNLQLGVWTSIAGNGEKSARILPEGWIDAIRKVDENNIHKTHTVVISGFVKYGTIFNETCISDFVFYYDPMSSKRWEIPSTGTIRAYHKLEG